MATWGNLVHRVLTMSARNFHETVPAPLADKQDSEGQTLLAAAKTLPEQVGSDIGAAQFRRGLER